MPSPTPNTLPRSSNNNQSIQIVVYSKPDSIEGKTLKRVLQENGFDFVEQDGGRADVVLELQKRLGRFVELPGLLVDGKTWIAETTQGSWKDGLDKYCVNKILESTANASSSSMIRDNNIFFRPFDPHQDKLGHRQISLPDGSKKSIIEITNELVQYHQFDNTVFKGQRSIDVFKRHFGAIDDGQAIRFGYRLVGDGILMVVEASSAGFGESEVRLFATLPGRNTMVAWPGRKVTQIGDGLRLLQGIRRTIHGVSQPGDPQRRLQLMHQLDLEVCALQACTLHKSSTLFLLQLFNVMILHYSLAHALPTTLPEILKLHKEIGYRIDGKYVTAADVRTWLLQGSSNAKLPLVILDEKKKSRIRLLLCAKAEEDDTDESLPQHTFAESLITTDSRLIFAMVWTNGMGSHEAPLDQIVASFCQSHIAIYNNTVFLPPLLRWFRRDFGTKPEAILESLQRSLPIEHRVKISKLQANQSLRVAFRQHHVTRVSRPVDLDDEEGTSSVLDQGSLLSCYLEGATVSDNNTMMAGMSVMGGMSLFSMGHQSSRFKRMQSGTSLAEKTAAAADGMQTTESSSSDEDVTRSVTEDSSTGSQGADYASWFQSEMSFITYGSDFDVLVNEAYLNNGEAEQSQRTISLLK